MKILELTDALNWSGGIEQIVLLSKGLKEQGEEIFIGCDPESRLFKAGNDLGLPVIDFYLQREIHIGTIRKIINFVKEKKIDIIHAHHPKVHTLGLISAYYLPDTVFIASRRVIYKIRNNFFSSFKYKSNRIDRIIAVSEAVKKNLVDQKVQSNKISVIYSCVDIKKFNPFVSGNKIREEFNIKPQDKLIGKIANYSIYNFKGQDIFLKAAQIVIKKIPETKFMLVGEGTQHKNLSNLAQDLGISNNIIFTGYRRDIPEIIAAFDISVNTSRFEGLAGVIRESSSMGKPVIATSVGGNPEIVKHNETGYLIQSEDIEMLAQYIIELLYNKNKREKFGSAGRKFIEENFSTDVTIKKTLELYKSLYNLHKEAI